MQKTDIIIRKFQNREDDAVRAIVSLTVHTDLGAIAIHDLKIIKTTQGRTLIAMPSTLDRKGKRRDVAHPVDEATRRNLEDAVYAAYERMTGRDIRDPEPGEISE